MTPDVEEIELKKMKGRKRQSERDGNIEKNVKPDEKQYK